MKSIAQQYADALCDAGPRSVGRCIELLRSQGLLPILPSIVRAVEERERAMRNQYVAASAHPLTAATRKHLSELIRENDAELTEVVDPELIGGVRVRIGDDRYDASVRGVLDQIRGAMV